MAKAARKKEPRRYGASIPIKDYIGVNTFGPHSTILLNELRGISNYDIYPGYLKSRRGSTNLQALADKFSAKDVLNAVPWAIGTSEYEIQQVLNGGTTEFWWCKILPTQTAHVQVLTLAGAALAPATADIADMKVSGNRLFIFHPSQNYIIEWNGAAFVARTMGLPKISLTSLAGTGASSLSGLFNVGVELLYQVGGVDLVASSPNRKTSAGKLLEINVTNQNILAQLDSATFPAPGSPGDYWTGVRAWRSKSRKPDFTDPLNPIDAEGVSSELYSEQIISKAALIAAAYQITLSKLDSELPADTTSEYQALTLESLELSPLPAAYTGAYHRNRIWVSRAQGVNDTTQSAVYYSNSAGDAYAEQYNPFNVLRAERGDGQMSIKLQSFESDLLILKEAKTMRVANGDPAAGIEVLDYNIGITHLKLAAFVPKAGICAITNDQGDFRIFGYDLQWTNIFNGNEISRSIRTQTAAMALAPTFVSFGYVNGKLLISDGIGTVYVFNAKEGKAWGIYSYRMNGACQFLMPFSKGSRCLVASKNTYLVEIEKDGLDTDIDTASDVAASIALSYTISRLQSDEGRDVLEMDHLSVVGQLSSNMQCAPFANGSPWPNRTTEKAVNFTPDIGTYPAGDAGLEREYQAYLEDRLLAQYQHFRMDTTAPATIRGTEWHGFVDEIGMGAGYFDPFINISSAQATPDWLDTAILDGGAGARDLATMDIIDAVDGPRDLSTMDILDRG